MKKYDLINLLTDYEMLVLDQRNRISNLRIKADKEMDNTKALNEFARANEEIYLKLKALIYEAKNGQPNNSMEALGTTESFPSSLEKLGEDAWKFHLPPFYSVSVQDKITNEGKHIYYLVLNLLSEYEKEYGTGTIKIIKSPFVYFEHHICTSTGRMFDYDNIDSKRAVDALQGYLLKDDNALCLTTAHNAVEDAEKSFCDIYIYDQEKCGSLSEYVRKSLENRG